MIYRIAGDLDLKKIITFINKLKKEEGLILNFLTDDGGELEKNRIINPRYFRALLFDFNSRVILVEENDKIFAIYVLYTPPKISITTALELIHYYGEREVVSIDKGTLCSQFQEQYSKVKLTLTQEVDELGEKFGFENKETINYLSGNDYVYSLRLEGE